MSPNEPAASPAVRPLLLLHRPALAHRGPERARTLCGAGLNCAIFLLIGKTSALTMNVAGVIKDWGLIMLSVAIYG